MGTESTASTVFKLWQQLTTEGNQLFDAGDMDMALQLYERARGVALANFSHWIDWDDAVAAVVVSFLNLSEAQARLGQVRRGAHTLCAVHISLLQTARDIELEAGLRTAASQYLGQTHAAMWRFRTRYGDQPQLTRWLDAGIGCSCCGRTAFRLPADPTNLH